MVSRQNATYLNNLSYLCKVDRLLILLITWRLDLRQNVGNDYFGIF
jgi:hypothetical protein